MINGRTSQIINRLINNIENGQSVPLSTGKVMVNKDEMLLMLRELESVVEGELKVYRDVNDRKGKIITDAKKEAESIIYEAEQTASRIRVTKRVSTIGGGFRADKLDNEDKMALRTATDIYAASLIYTDEMLTEVNDLLSQAYDYVNRQYGRMLSDLEQKANIIANNKAELMTNLKELSREDRYEQILELAQLLSNELYSERQKMKEMEYEGGRNEKKALSAQEDTVKKETFKENAVRESAAKEDAVRENVSKENVAKEDAVRENAARESAVKKNTVKENTEKVSTKKEYDPEEDSAFASVKTQRLPVEDVKKAKAENRDASQNVNTVRMER
ncbi:MAG: hypothetical protein HDT40_06270 [Lachnospiraceae bacterium]|nr:hypothetical protein [Lachnospiraceae bacterium]